MLKFVLNVHLDVFIFIESSFWATFHWILKPFFFSYGWSLFLRLMSSAIGVKKCLPTAMLSHDVLALIFEINSEISSFYEKERPLNSTRATSQVCQSWRTLLLDLPKIWGRLIDLDAMARGKSEWWEEVLRRTRSSPLWIIGTVPESPAEGYPLMDIGSYFIRLLKSWNRIQKIDVEIYGEEISWQIKVAFLSPAPLLEEFEVYLPDFRTDEFLYIHTLQQNYPRPIFSNHAPSLVTMNADRFAFRTDSPWLFNLREIKIPAYLEAPGILQLLSHTPLLETLSLYCEPHPESWDPFNIEPRRLSAQINLPHLSSMSVAEDFSSCAVILNRVSPAKNCSLSLDCVYHTPPPAHMKAALMERLPTYIVNYFTAHSESPTQLSIRVDAAFNMFSFDDHLPGRRSSSFFRSALFTGGDPFDVIVSMIQAIVASNKLQPCLFKNITKLVVHLKSIPTSAYPDIYHMLLMFQSVEHLITDETDTHSILKISTHDYGDDSGSPRPELFPSIHTLKIKRLSGNSGSAEDDILLQFLERRRDAGLAISRLDLIDVQFNELQNISALERMDGLEVVWRTVDGESRASYVCGRGENELLRFNSDPRA